MRATLLRLALVAALALTIVAGFSRPAAAQNSGTVTVNATLVRTLTLLITTPIATFGVVSPGGIGGLTDSTTNNSYFVATAPLVSVVTNAAWSGTIKGTDATTPATTLTVAAGSLHATHVAASVALPPVVPTTLNVPLTYADAAALPAVSTTAQPWVTNGVAGVSNYAEIYALRVLTTDRITAVDGGGLPIATGTFSATVTYSASN